MNVNTHIHTPYSYSVFSTMKQAVEIALEEDIVALAINDFNTIDGYDEFSRLCHYYKIYPLFGIEFITISHADQRDGLRWNDPIHPGVMYLCGKGLSFPYTIGVDSRNLIGAIWKGTQDRIWSMIHKLNEYIKKIGLNYELDYHSIRNRIAYNSVQEYHLAKALYFELCESRKNPIELMSDFRTLFDDPMFSGDITDTVLMQQEIRNRLLSTGKAGYIEEQKDAFLKFNEAKSIILQARGIPCYPFLLDESIGFTEYEGNIELLTTALNQMNIHAVEFISHRVPLNKLKKYARYLYDLGFCVTFGTEHNTPEMLTLVPVARDGIPLDRELEQINYDGACIIAAHQELNKQNQIGFVDSTGSKKISQQKMSEFIKFGDTIIQKHRKSERN